MADIEDKIKEIVFDGMAGTSVHTREELWKIIKVLSVQGRIKLKDVMVKVVDAMKMLEFAEEDEEGNEQ